MDYRRLGDSDLEVSEICLGSFLTYGAGVGREQTEACTRAAFDAGINFFDTANVYGRGAAEQVWGEILSDHPRDSYVLATKVYMSMRWKQRPSTWRDQGLSRKQIHKQIDAGKVRYIGFSEWTPEQIQAALDIPGVEKFVSSQPQYSILHRKPETGVIPLCRANGISQIAFAPLAQGVLTGKYEPGERPPADSRAASAEMGVGADG